MKYNIKIFCIKYTLIILNNNNNNNNNNKLSVS